jgi:hypothetical protein
MERCRRTFQVSANIVLSSPADKQLRLRMVLNGSRHYLEKAGSTFIPAEESVDVLTKARDGVEPHMLVAPACQKVVDTLSYFRGQACFGAGLEEGKLIKTIVAIVQYGVPGDFGMGS